MEIPDQSPHYVRALAEMSDHRMVIAHEDIYAANGMKLLAKGARIRSSDRERLSLHKLRAPLDSTLEAEDSVDTAQLLSDLDRAVKDDALASMLSQHFTDQGGLRLAIHALDLPLALRFRLTVMRDQRLALYQHSLRVALMCYAMAHQLRFSHQDKQDILVASLSHDIGEMHTDPALLDPMHEITASERSFIDVHPLTAHVVLAGLGLNDGVLRAVLEHHERLDGSGYPNRVGGAPLGRLGRLLAIAEVVEAVGRRDGLAQLDIVLRLSRGRLDHHGTNVLRGLLELGKQGGDSGDQHEVLARQIRHVLDILACWQGCALRSDGANDAFLSARMDNLRSIVLQTGLSLDDNSALIALVAEDHHVGAELNRALAEVGWLMEDLAHEIERRAPSFDAERWAGLQALLTLLRVAA